MSRYTFGEQAVRPDFTDWLRDRAAPETEWRPEFLRGIVFMQGTGELLDWVGQGFGGVNVTELLDAVEASCRRRRFDPHTVLIAAERTDQLTEPYVVHNDRGYHPSMDDDLIVIRFTPIKEGI